MRITLEIAGGFTGRAGAERIELDLVELPQLEAAQLRELVAAAKLPPVESHGALLKHEPRAWDFVHELTVAVAGTTRRIRYHLDVASPELRALAEAVLHAGRK